MVGVRVRVGFTMMYNVHLVIVVNQSAVSARVSARVPHFTPPHQHAVTYQQASTRALD
jgi:hypothetical protein